MATAADNTLVRMKLGKIMDDLGVQRAQGTGRANENFGKGEHYIQRAQNYGISSVPPEGAFGLVQALNGNPDHSILGFIEHPGYRPKNLQPKDQMLYTGHNMEENGEHQDYVKLTENELKIHHKKKIIIEVGTSTITIEENKITIKADRVDIN